MARVADLDRCRDFLLEARGEVPADRDELYAWVVDFAYDHRRVGDPDDFFSSFCKWFKLS